MTPSRRGGFARAIALLATSGLGACSGGAAGVSSDTPPAVATVTSAAATATAAVSPSPSAVPSAAAATAKPGPVAALGTALVGPTGLLFDAAGNLYVSGCTWTESYIYRIDPDGMLTTYAGAGLTAFLGDGGPALAAYLQCPVVMAIAPDGALVFADHASNRIRRIDAAGIITTIAGSGAPGVDAGSFSGDGGPATSATLQEPWGVAFDDSGNLYVGDRDNDRVRRVDPKGMISTVDGTGEAVFAGDGGAVPVVMCPHGVAVDSSDNLVIADPCNNRIRRVDGHGKITTIAGTGTQGFSGDGGKATKAAIDRPDFPVFDKSGAMFFVSGPRIRRIDAAGVITTIAGNGTFGVPEDGMVALDAPFTELYGLAVDADGNVYAAEGATYVYKIDTKGIITVFAGTS